MANLTPEQILRGIIDGSIEEIDGTGATALAYNKLRGIPTLEKLIIPDVKSVSSYAISGDINITEFDAHNVSSIATYGFSSGIGPIDVYLPKVTSMTSSSYAFREIRAKAVYLPNATGVIGIGIFQGPDSTSATFGPEIICMPKAERISGGAGFLHNHFLRILDVALNTIAGYECNNCYVLQTLILRGNAVATLGNTTAFTNSPIQGYQGRTCTIYVPSDLISSYQTATNWSTYYNAGYISFVAIEGSVYEKYYAGVYPIGIDGTGLIAHYDVGNSSKWDSETKTIASNIETDIVAYNTGDAYHNQTLATAADVPTDFYDGYARCGLNVEFGKALSNVSDIITFEFCCGINNTSGIGLNVGAPGTAGAEIVGYVGVNMRNFRHVVVELSANKVDLYIDNVKINISPSFNMSNHQMIRLPTGGTKYIGQVSIWNRALTAEERAQHYQYYVNNYHVGETAYDENGNFVAT